MAREVSGLYPYEVLLIFDPRPTEEDIAALLIKLQETLKSLGGEVTKAESWGKRRLAYEIRKQREGTDRKSTRLNSSHIQKSRMPSSA